MKVGINGMGRIGRLALRAAMGAAERGADDPRAGNRLEVVHLNELKGGAAATAHLLAFDSVQGRWRADIAAEGEDTVRIDDRRLSFSSHASAAEIPWGDLGVDVVLECTGKFLTPETLQGHLDRGAKRVIVAAPVKVGDVLNIVVGVNEHLYEPGRHRILTAAFVVLLTACGKTDDGQTVGQKFDQSIATAEAKTSELKAEAKEGLAETKASAEHAADSAAQKIDDAAVTATINAELVKDPALSAIKIDVDTQDGRVLQVLRNRY